MEYTTVVTKCGKVVRVRYVSVTNCGKAWPIADLVDYLTSRRNSGVNLLVEEVDRLVRAGEIRILTPEEVEIYGVTRNLG